MLICIFQQQVLETDCIPTITPVQDTSSPTMSIYSFQQLLKSNSSGLQSLFFSQLEIESPKAIMDFRTELFTSHDCQKGNSPENDYLSSPMLISPMVSVQCTYSS